MKTLVVCLLLSCAIVQPLSAQTVTKKIRQYERTFQFSMFPGISTNGIHSGSFYNKYSFNLFGGLSAGNRVLEVSPITNINIKSGNGLQFAGLANVVGANAFINLSLPEERLLINEEDFVSTYKGIQTAGLLNYVRDGFTGIQVAGALNVVQGDFKGFQFAGIGNSAAGGGAGIQLAGLYNIAHESMGGFQISLLFNHTEGEMAGAQIGLINKAGRIKGKKSTPPTRARGFQFGLINSSKEMDDVQIGLINFGGATRGKQIGLINFFEKFPSKERTRMGTPIGLINIGSKGSYFRLHYNEIFPTNLEYTTGNCFNCTWIMGSEMPYEESNQKYNQNALIVGYNPMQKTWGLGYGFHKVLYNKFTIMPSPFNKKRVITYGLRFIHLNRDMTFDKTFNLVNRLSLDYGKRWHGMYVFMGISVNYFLMDASENETEKIYHINSAVASLGKVSGLNSYLWPGYAVGLQF